MQRGRVGLVQVGSSPKKELVTHRETMAARREKLNFNFFIIAFINTSLLLLYSGRVTLSLAQHRPF